MMDLYNHHFKDEKLSIRDKMNKINKLISIHEEEIANPILENVSNNKSIRLIGKNKITNKNRAPTISITSNKSTSKELSNFLIKNNIATRNDNFYAWRCLKALKIDTNDGVVRLSLTHYNSLEDTNYLLKIINKFDS